MKKAVVAIAVLALALAGCAKGTTRFEEAKAMCAPNPVELFASDGESTESDVSVKCDLDDSDQDKPLALEGGQ